MDVDVTYANKRWGHGRLRQLLLQRWHAVFGHDCQPWRMETEDWWVRVDGPQVGAWRTCQTCGAIESVVA